LHPSLILNRGGCFRDCLLIKQGTTVRQLASLIHPDLDKNYQYTETVGGIRVKFLFFFILYTFTKKNIDFFSLNSWEKTNL
jgi:hypothetical protein